MSIYTWGYFHNNYKDIALKFDTLALSDPICYRYNSLGFRGAEIEPKTPCVVSFGCGHTVGTGVQENQRFADQLAQQLNLAHYSFAADASDMQSVLQNINYFFKNNQHELDVKLFVVFWPDFGRLPYLINGKQKSIIKTYYLDNDTESILYRSYKEKSGLLQLIENMKTVETICKLANIPVLQMTYNNLLLLGFGYKQEIESLIYDPNLYDKNKLIHLDYVDFVNASQRIDLENHSNLTNFGIQTHSLISQQFYEAALLKYPTHFSKVAPAT